ncbi:copper-binding protein [Aquabacterium sp. OR-4]|uniref:copper-binding protein n=1 Tax=Aquabacterium sp. OR-4 TaxID=2978127 RepID=UPI0021B34037|nr:copper-binding protein [Aquabacterium sp. OR-4]MDT7834560.1 copper-binding protein [Aquabacterium sp. OR-4]
MTAQPRRRPALPLTRHAALGLALAAMLSAGPARAQATEGEVRKIDLAQAKVTLKHGEIKNLDMPAMTMSFRVADPKLLEGLSEGSKVRFDVEKRNGQYTVVRLVPAR